MSKLRLSLACSNYDRTRAIHDGRVSVDGIDLTCLDLPIEETFFRMLRHREFDVAELSLSSYSLSRLLEPAPFIAIPVFPSRFFRHSCIYVNTQSGIREPKHLIGKRVGLPEYQMTANVWIRGILADDHGVPVDSVQYLTGGQEDPGRPEKLSLQLPPTIKVCPIGEGETLSQLLERGEIDALYTARTPSTFQGGRGRVQRLFTDYVTVERAYFERTRIFPIMHTLVIRREVYEANRWIAQSLLKAFAAAQRLAYRDLFESAALSVMLPWLVRHAEETEALMGGDFWPYGFSANEHTLQTFLRYHHQQGLSPRQLEARELFASETFESYKV